MDQRAHDVEEDLKHILQTRLALADKIETLERQVEATVESTKAAALEVLDHAKQRAASFIESASRQLNPSIQAGRRPWVMVGSAVALGLLAGLIEHRRRESRVYRYYPPKAEGADVMPEDGRSHEPKGVYPFYGHERARPYPSQPPSEMWKPVRALWDDLTGEVAQERERLQNAVLHAGRAFVHDIVRMAGQSLLDQLSPSGGSGARRLDDRRARSE